MSIDFADVKPSLLSWMIVGLMSVTFISFWKFIASRFNFPLGVAQLVSSI